MPNIDASTLPVYPLICDDRAGARVLKCRLDFAANPTYTLHLGYQTAQNVFRTVRSIYIDNGANRAEVIVQADTGYQVIAPPQSQGTYTIVVGSPFTLTFTSTGGVTVDAWLFNHCVEPSVWELGTAAAQAIIDVTNFGAVGDGIADDTTAIQSAIAAAAAAGGGTVYFPVGIYKITAPLRIDGTSPVALRGAGYDPQPSTFGTIIKNTGTGDAISVNPAHGPVRDTEIVFADFRLDGAATTGNGITVYQHNGVRIDNVWIDGHGAHGVYLELVGRFLAVHMAVFGNSQSGLYAHSSSDVVLIDCLASGNAQSGGGNCNLWFYASSAISVTGSRVTASGGIGVAFSVCQQVSLSSSEIDRNASDGVQLQGTNGYLIEGCLFIDCVMTVASAMDGMIGTCTWNPATAGKTVGWVFDAGSRAVLIGQNVMGGAGTVVRTSGYGQTFLDQSRIGVGKGAPAYPLDVAVAGPGAQVAAQLTNTDSATNSEVRLIFNEAAVGWFQGIGASYNNGSPSLAFACGSVPNGWVERMRIAANGNVGIGTQNPAALLNVKRGNNPDSTGQPSGTFAAVVYNGSNFLGENGLLVKNNWAAQSSTVLEIGCDLVGGAYRPYVHVDGIGNVGIGIIAPAYVLDVAGDINCTGAVRIGGAVLLSTWRSVAGAGGAAAISRVQGTTYQNTTGRTLFVSVTAQNTVVQNLIGYVGSTFGGITPVVQQYQATPGGLTSVAFFVPAAYYYQVAWGGGSPTLNQWHEWN